MIWRDIAPLEQAHAYRLHRVSRLLRRNLRQALAEVSTPAVSPEQYFLLFRLAQRDGQQQGELVDPVLNDRANISRHIDALCRRGLVERRPASTDRRCWRVFLTENGQELALALRARVLRERHRLFGGLSAPDRLALTRALARLEQILS